MVFAWAFAAFLSTLAGGAFAFYNRKQLTAIMSFSAGMLIGVVFLDLLPEIVERAAPGRFRGTMLTLVLGFLAIFLLEKLTVIHGERDHDVPDHHHHVGVIGAVGLGFHSFLDGLAIGSGFQAGAAVGLGIVLAVLSHDFADGLNTVTYLLASKNAPGRTAGFLVAQSLAPVAGVALATQLAIPSGVIPYQLAFFAGFLLYMGASDLLPHVHEKPRPGLLAITLAGIATSGLLVTLLER